MSYILEALKKSEKQRQQQRSGDLFSSPSAGTPHPEQKQTSSRGFFLIILAFIAILGISSGIVLFTDGEPDEKTIATQQSNTSTPLSPPVEKTDVSSPPRQDEVLQLKREQQKIVYRELPENVPATGQDREIREPAPLAETPPPFSQQRILNQEIQQANLKYAEVPYLEELDKATRLKIPAMKLAGHTYSQNPSRRLILINNSVVRENDIVERAFILEKILPDSIILRKGDLRFRLKARKKL